MTNENTFNDLMSLELTQMIETYNRIIDVHGSSELLDKVSKKTKGTAFHDLLNSKLDLATILEIIKSKLTKTTVTDLGSSIISARDNILSRLEAIAPSANKRYIPAGRVQILTNIFLMTLIKRFA